MPKINSFKKARQLSAEGLQVVTKKARQPSAEGLQAVSERPRYISAEGLQVVPDSSLEVVWNDSGDEKLTAGGEQRRNLKKRISNARVYGVRVIWIVIAISIFVIGIAFGGVVVAAIESKGKLRQNPGTQSIHSTVSAIQSSLKSTPTTFTNSVASRSTTRTTVTTTSSSAIIAIANSEMTSVASITLSSTSSVATAATSATSNVATNFQTFTGALGGVAADAITSTGNTTRPFAVGGNTFTDYNSAVVRSCGNQHSSCADVSNEQGAQITIGECDTQQTACLAAAGTNTVTA